MFSLSLSPCTAELGQASGAISAPELGTLSVEVTIQPLDTKGCLSFTLSDDIEVEDVDEQYRSDYMFPYHM